MPKTTVPPIQPLPDRDATFAQYDVIAAATCSSRASAAAP
jgi:hypothetical protein